MDNSSKLDRRTVLRGAAVSAAGASLAAASTAATAEGSTTARGIRGWSLRVRAKLQVVDAERQQRLLISTATR
jgi:hypothetical protein